jgi:hypothetical protein
MRRSFLVGLAVILLAIAAWAIAQKRVVLSIDGDWWDANGEPLGFARPVNGKCVFGQGGSLQVADAGTKAAQTFVYEKLGNQCPCGERPAHIPRNARCVEARIGPGHSGTTEASASGAGTLGKIFDWLMRNPQMYVVAAARGIEDDPLEAVVPLAGSEVDLAASLQSLPKGAYAIRLVPVDGAGALRGKLAWAGAGAGKASIAGIAPGLYKLSAAVEGGESESAQAWVLISAPATYAADAKEFHEAAETTRNWRDRVDESGKRAVLRACLALLAGAGKSQ